MKNYRDIIDEIETITSQHVELQRFISGPLSEVDFQKLEQDAFPFCYAECTSADIERGAITFSFDITVATLINDDLTDRKDAYDSTLFQLRDVINALLHSAYSTGVAALIDNRIDLQLPLTCTPFTARFENDLTGWSATVDIVLDNDNNLCIAPFA